MATKIAVFAGKNKAFREYLRWQREEQLALAVDQMREAHRILRHVLPVLGLQSSNFTDHQLQVQLNDLSDLEQIPGIAIVTDKGPGAMYRYHVCKLYQGVVFYCWTNGQGLKALCQPAGGEPEVAVTCD